MSPNFGLLSFRPAQGVHSTSCWECSASTLGAYQPNIRLPPIADTVSNGQVNYLFLPIGVAITVFCWILGRVPNPRGGWITRASDPGQFYLCLAVYVLVGGIITLGTWIAK